jgi:HAD superfamily hydrolase (TIGR01509 family)
MDGTLVNTEPRWIEGQKLLASEFDILWKDEDALSTVGRPMPVSAALLRERGVPLTVEQIIERQLAHVVASLADGIPWLPGAYDLLMALRDSGVPCALVTMAYRPVAERVAAGAPEGTFAAVVAGDDVTHGKPHPEPYLTGADRIGLDPVDCVAVEDTLNGTLSAEAAGCAMLTVRGVTPVPAALGRSRVASLTEVSPEMLGRIVRGEVIDTLMG